MVTLYIMRHGETDLNVEHRMQGRQNLPLNANGLRQAAEHRREIEAAGLSFSRVYSSPLDRSLVTATTVAACPKEEIRIDERLIEIDYGPFEGLTYHELDNQMVDFFRDPVHNAPPEGVEHIRTLIDRVSAFLEEIRNDESAEGNILISTHGVVMRAMMAYFSDLGWSEIWTIMIGNCETFVTDLKDGAFTEPRVWTKDGQKTVAYRPSPLENRGEEKA